MIAALYVEKGGCYYGLPNVDPWDKERDARLYAGPCPVIAHPPCERWGSFWYGGPLLAKQGKRKEKGDDGGCFLSALAAVRRWSGVLEHPAGSQAWRAFGLNTPPRAGGWITADFVGGWTCCVEQGHYGHAARKATWLYATGVDLPFLKWGASAATKMISGPHREVRGIGGFRLSDRERRATPLPFRDLLISIAESAQRKAA